MFVSHLGELGLIERLRQQIPKSKRVICGIGDDTAVLRWTPSRYLLLTTDMMVEGVHFTQKMPAKEVGHKAIACNLSDIAAMGGLPKYAVISLGVPGRLDVRWVDQFYQGMRETARRFGTDIVGGDTVRSPQVIINVALAGKVFKNQLVTRAGAKVGDQIFVTGPLGNSLKSGWHLKFVPRLQESQYLVKNFHPTAMIDVSDGLASDLGHILKESGVGAKIYEFEIPLRRGASLHNALDDGEDFELLFTLSPREAKALLGTSKFSFNFFQIGEITDRKAVLECVDKKGNRRPIAVKGYVHF